MRGEQLARQWRILRQQIFFHYPKLKNRPGVFFMQRAIGFDLSRIKI